MLLAAQLLCLLGLALGNSIPAKQSDIGLQWPSVCGVCEKVVEDIYGYMEKGQTIDFAERVAEGVVCDHLPTLPFHVDANTICQGLVKQYAPQIIELVEQKLSPTTVCTKLILCSQLSSDLDHLFMDMMHYFRGRVTGELKSQIGDLSIGLQWPSVCGVCDKVVEVIYSFVEKGQTIEVAEGLVCNLFPFPVNAMCQGVVKQYAPQIIELVEQKLPPTTVCTKLILCSKLSSDLDHLFMDMMQAYHGKVGEWKPPIGAKGGKPLPKP